MSLGPRVLSRADQLPSGNFLAALPVMPYPKSVLMCPPEYFDLVDVKNPYMKKHVGKLDGIKAREQWAEIKRCFEEIGVRVEVIPAAKDCEDMVFAANQIFAGLSADGDRVCMLSRMKFPSRQREVDHFAAWFKGKGYRVHEITAGKNFFEGGGDAIWHPGRGLIWGGYGVRSDAAIYPEIAVLFGVPVITLELKHAHFYHLDTCFCPIDETTALVHSPSLSETGQELIRAVFKNVVEVNEHEATECMACNATAFGGKNVVMQRGAKRTVESLRKLGFQVHELETGEFMKSGGSVFCMKTALF